MNMSIPTQKMSEKRERGKKKSLIQNTGYFDMRGIRINRGGGGKFRVHEGGKLGYIIFLPQPF